MHDRQVPSGTRNLVLPNKAKIVSSQKRNTHQKRSSKSLTKEATHANKAAVAGQLHLESFDTSQNILQKIGA